MIDFFCIFVIALMLAIPAYATVCQGTNATIVDTAGGDNS